MLDQLVHISGEVYLILGTMSVIFLFLGFYLDTLLYKQDTAIICLLVAFWPLTFLLATVISVCFCVATIIDTFDKYFPSENVVNYVRVNNESLDCNTDFELIIEIKTWVDFVSIDKICTAHNIPVVILSVPTWRISSKKTRLFQNKIPEKFKIYFDDAADKATFQFYWACREICND